ncbi:hypothetical protein C2G38_2156584 [Gigaspora rosea]|uniref:Uncharacterized protein n=1 Tax=Gigaspora rosea TaxID=44941 RepID=A0A397W9A2_9GLOM|nr:hypothetical protein C2G38_2156584 [Gigaspora rosea]
MDKSKNEINLKDFETYLGPIKDCDSPIKRKFILKGPIRQKDGKIIGMLVVSEDTTDKFLSIERIGKETSNNLTQLIKELTVKNPKVTEIWEEKSENSENLLHLYNKITDAKIRKEVANREVINLITCSEKFYFNVSNTTLKNLPIYTKLK